MDALAYDVVLWDWNGTLLDDGTYGRRIIDGMLRRRGLAVPTEAEHVQLFDFPVVIYYERLGFDFEKEPFEVVSQEFVDAYIANARSCPLREGTRETLTRLQELGYRQSMLSASRQDYLDQLIEHYGLNPFLEEKLGIDTVHAPGKTARGCQWIKESGLDPARVVLVGDTVHDGEVADEMGIACMLIEGGHHATERLLESGKPVHKDLSSVLEVLISREGIISA